MIQVQITDKLAWVEINRPKQKNALSIRLLQQLLNELKSLESNNKVSVIIIFGKENFSSGGDINDMNIETEQEAIRIATQVQDIYSQIESIEKPIIAYTKGLVYGGGFELALVCDIIFSHNNSSFSLPETSLGIIPGGGATQRLKNVVGKHNASYILMSGKIFTAGDMYRLNLIQDIFDNIKDVEKEALIIAKNNNIASQELKKLLSKNNDFKSESESFSKLIMGEGKKGIENFLKYKKK